MTEDFYDLLEIPSDASQDEIKDAYREQVRVYHPDLNDDDRAQAQFTAVKTAYDILGDPVERQAYDRLGHEDYVAKRTSGLPSPDVWQSDDDDDEDDGTELSYSESETASASASSATAGSATAGSTGTTSSRSSATAGAGGTAAGASGSSAGTAADASNATGTSTGTAGGGGSGTADRTGGPSDGTDHGTDRSGGSDARSGAAANPLVRWWQRQNFSLPLIWLSVLVYVAGVGHFALANRDALSSLWADVRATGADPAGIWALLSEHRHGVETTTAFVRGVEFVTPPLEPTLWYAALAGVVALALGSLLVTRVLRRADTWGAVTINETIVVAVALGVATTLAGGPLLAGAVLMPLLFGVIIRHTRRLPGWKPSYLYVVPVLAPAVGFGAAVAGAATLPLDLAAFVVVPLLGGLALPLRTTIRKHFGR